MNFLKSAMGNLGGLGDMGKLMGQLGNLANIVKNIKATGKSSCGMVTVTSYKTQEFGSRLSSIKINKMLLDPARPEALEKAILEATNNSLDQEQELLKAEASKIKDL